MSEPGLEVYIDFDNTISLFDVLDDVIQRFSVTEDWKIAEAEWMAGKTGSRECLERQMGGVRVSEETLGRYLDNIPIDPGFGPMVDFLRQSGIEPVILSDSFTPIISRVLDQHEIRGVAIYASALRHEGDRLNVSFPYAGSICSTNGNCKCSHLFRRNRPIGTRKVYIGDGRSDVCPAGFCEILFAKDKLLQHTLARHRGCIPFRNLGEVHAQLQTLIHDRQLHPVG